MLSWGETTFKPSTALRTEIAGVIKLSPKNSAAPKVPRTITNQRVLEVFDFFSIFLRSNAVKAKTPPSPWLSARMIIKIYLIETTIINAQVINDKTPSTDEVIPAPDPWVASTESLRAYSGDVPISPKTTPSAAIIKRGKLLPLPFLLFMKGLYI